MIKFPTILVLVIGTAHASLAQSSIEELKVRYLVCEQRSQSARLSATDAAGCSETYEELKQRAFGGDFRRLVKWYDGTRDNRVETHSDPERDECGERDG